MAALGRVDSPPSEPAALAELFAAWRAHSPLASQCVELLRTHKHGNLPRWRRALAALPNLPGHQVADGAFDAKAWQGTFGETIAAGAADALSPPGRQALRTALLKLLPWRKGPFNLCGVHIDAEWRSDRKWARIAPHIDLAGRRVLDVGCGNGYYGWRMVAAGAASVTGIDQNPLFALQHAAVCHFLPPAVRPLNVVLPLLMDEGKEPTVEEPFDVIFSMGVIYHRHDPAGHVKALAAHARDDALLVLESLIVDGEPIRPRYRYACMNNVRLVPNAPLLLAWVRDAGFARAELVDVSTTTTDEQRATEWMPFHSLANTLHPADATRTVEGYPAPRRAVVIARR